MRALALLLIFVNLVYLGWAVLVDAPTPPPAAATSEVSESPRLVLASERVPAATTIGKTTQRATAAKSQTSLSDSISESPKEKCMSVGPFQDLPTVVEASAILKGAGFDSRQRLEQGELWVGYWVSVSGFTAHEQAERALARLKENGISDAYILPGADPSNVISLGVFKEHDRAQRRMTEAKNLGFGAQMADRTRAGSVYWIDVDLKNAEQTLDTSILGSQPGKIVRLELRPCAAGGG